MSAIIKNKFLSQLNCIALVPPPRSCTHNMHMVALNSFLPCMQDAIIPIIASLLLALICHTFLSAIFRYGVIPAGESSANTSAPAPRVASLPVPLPRHWPAPSEYQPSPIPLCPKPLYGQPIVEKVSRTSEPFLCPNDAPEDQFTLRMESSHDQYVIVVDLAGFHIDNM